MPPAVCKEPDCERPKHRGRHRCAWHYLLTLSMDEQVGYAERRLKLKQSRPSFEHRSRVPADQWPEGTRFCSGCQYFVPLFYVSGSRCKACSSRASHASRIEKVYEITREEYDALLAWQGGVCFICGQQPRGRRLAIDHDHQTNAVRGLLCASPDWGCNLKVVGIIEKADDPIAVARRLLAYLQGDTPMSRLAALS